MIDNVRFVLERVKDDEECIFLEFIEADNLKEMLPLSVASRSLVHCIRNVTSSCRFLEG